MTTRADAEAEIVARLGRWMTVAGLDGTTVSGANASLDSPLGYALRAVSASDITAVSSAFLDQFYDIAEWRTLESILQNYTKVDSVAGPVSAKLDELGQRMERRLAAMRAYIAATYGIGITTGTLTAGTITLDLLEPLP